MPTKDKATRDAEKSEAFREAISQSLAAYLQSVPHGKHSLEGFAAYLTES